MINLGELPQRGKQTIKKRGSGAPKVKEPRVKMLRRRRMGKVTRVL